MTAHESETSSNRETSDLLATDVIPPLKLHFIYVDEYKNEALTPKLIVEVLAYSWDVIGWIPRRLTMPDGSVRLSVLVQSFTDQPVTVNVRQHNNGR